MKHCLVALFLVVSWHSANAQALRVGVPLSNSLEAKSTHTYTFETEEGRYVYGYANQISVDVVVTVKEPDGDTVGEYDSPARGPEPFQFTPDETGTYTIEVAPYEGAEGDYEILLVANEPRAKRPRALVDQMMKPYTGRDRPGAVVSIVKDGKVVLAKGYGMANLTYDVPMTKDTGMSIASVSKQFTGMALVLLEQDGKLSLDDDVRKHMPELKDFGTPVTIRNMLNHTSGYREVLNFLPMAGWRATDAMRDDEPLRIVQRQTNLQNEPGSRYNYNNTTFMLLARLVERVSGQDWKTFMEERVFRPLGMNNTTVKTHQGQVIPNSSQGYENAPEGGFRYVTDFAAAYGASGVNSTAADMAKWMANYHAGTVGGEEAIDKLTTRGILASGDTTGYALGLGVSEWRGLSLYAHSGGETSHRSWFGYFPEINSGIFISSNNPGFSRSMWSDFAEAYFGEHLESNDEDESPEGTDTPPAVAEAAEAQVAEPSPEQLEAIAGMWNFIGAPLTIEYTVEEGNLFAQATNQPRFALTATSDSTFEFVGVAARVTFHFEDDGTVTRATHHQGPDSPMEKIVAPPLTVEQLAEFAGRYYNDELETYYTMKVVDGKLMAHHRWYEPFGITHVVDDEFSGGQWFFGDVAFHRDPTGAISGFMVGNSRTRDVWFERR